MKIINKMTVNKNKALNNNKKIINKIMNKIMNRNNKIKMNLLNWK